MAGAFRYGGPDPISLAGYVQQQGQMGKQAGEDSRLARLVSGAMADPSARKSNLAEIASFRPEAAFAAQGQFDQQDDRKYAELGKRAAVLAGAPEAMRPQVWAQLRPELEQTFGMQGLPAEVTPEIIQTAQQLAQVYGGMGDSSQLPASVREAMAFRDDPSLLDTRRQMYGSYSYGEVPLPDGTVGQTRRNSRTGEMELVLPGGRVVPMAGATPTQGGPEGYSPPASQPSPSSNGDPKMDAIVKAANDMRAAGIPTAQIDAWMQQLAQNTPGVEVGAPQAMPTSGGPAPAPAPAPARPTLDRVPINEYGGGSGWGRTPEAEAAAKKRAELETELSFADRQAAADAEAARLKKLAEAGAKREAEAPKRVARYRQALSASQNVIDAIDSAETLISPGSTGFLGARMRGVEGSDAFNLAAQIETVKANLGFDRLQQMRENSPTGGALGAVAVQELTALQSTIANLDPNQDASQLAANLKKVRGHYQAWQDAVNKAIEEESRGAQRPATGGGESRRYRFNPETGELE